MGGSHPARPLLAGVVVFWRAGRLREVGVRGGKGNPGTREGPLVRRQKLVVSRHGLVACWRVKGGVGSELCRSGLDPHANTCISWTGGNEMTRLATIAAKTSIRSATTFLEGEWASGTSGSI